MLQIESYCARGSNAVGQCNIVEESVHCVYLLFIENRYLKARRDHFKNLLRFSD